MFPPTTPFQQEGLVNTIRQEQEIKKIQTGKKETKSSLFMDHKIIHAENLKELTKILLELISNNSKVTQIQG